MITDSGKTRPASVQNRGQANNKTARRLQSYRNARNTNGISDIIRLFV
jgi:hypothetical protein